MPITRKIGHNLSPTVELSGDWIKAKLLLSSLPSSVKEGSENGRRAAANQLKRIVRRNIRNNGSSLGWVPLSSSYKKKKASKGFSPDRIYYASGTYYNNIKIWEKGDRIYVGLKGRVKSNSSPNRLTIGKIARILEYGSPSRNIPARPLWAPSFKQFGGNKRIKGYMTWHIRNVIKKSTGISPKLTF